jgi:membrane associated rhomboid family serine protease
MISLRDSVPVHRWPVVTWLLIGMNGSGQRLSRSAVDLAVPVEASRGVAWWAHIGGFVMGSAVASLLRLGQRERRRWCPEYAPW